MIKSTITFVLIAILVFLLIRSGLFTIKEIDIVAKDIACADEKQLKNSSGLLGQNFFLANFKKTAKNLEDRFICIRDIKLSLVFPDKIKIEASGRQPVAVLALLQNKEASPSSFLENMATPSAEESEDAYLIDSEGVIFSKDTGGVNIPNIFTKGLNLSLGKKTQSKKVEDSLKILEKVKTFGLDVKMSTILDNFFIIFSYPKIAFRLDDRVDIQVASLQLILSEAKINRRTIPTEVGRDFKELEFIDLRFDKPIVKFAPKKNGER